MESGRWWELQGGKELLVAQQIFHGDGFQCAVERALEAFPCLAYRAVAEAGTVFRIFQATGQFNAAFHQLDDAAEGQFFRFAQQDMPAFGAADAAGNTGKPELAQDRS